MTAARCVLCDRLLIGVVPSPGATIANPDGLVLCGVCDPLPPAEHKQRRGQIIMRLLDDTISQRRRRHA